jgi:hypothetical protein
MHNERDVAPDHWLVDDTRALSATRSAQALPSNSRGSRSVWVFTCVSGQCAPVWPSTPSQRPFLRFIHAVRRRPRECACPLTHVKARTNQEPRRLEGKACADLVAERALVSSTSQLSVQRAFHGAW